MTTKIYFKCFWRCKHWFRG